MDELAGLAEAAGAQVVLRVSQERARPDAATFLGRGKLETARRGLRRGQRRRRDLRQRAVAGAAAADRSDHRPEDGRSDAADSRHLRAARADARRQVAGRARAARVPAAAAGRLEPRALAAGRRHRHARSRRNEARNRPAPHPHAHPPHRQGHRRSATPARATARAAAEAGDADGGAGRLHQRRQDDALQPADPRGAPKPPTRCS